MPLSADGRLKLQALDDDVLEHKPGLSVDDDEAAILELATKILAIVGSIDSTTKDTMARTLWMNTKQTKFLAYCYNHNCTCWIDFICCCTIPPRLSMGPPVTDGMEQTRVLLEQVRPGAVGADPTALVTAVNST